MRVGTLPFALTLASLLLIGAPALCAQRSVNVRRAVTPTASIRIMGSFAELRIRGWSKDSIEVTGTIPADARFDGGFLASDKSPSNGAKFYLETASGVPNGKLELRVPAAARVWAKSGSATISVDSVIGGLDLNIIGGSVSVRGNPHEVVVESMDGNVRVDGAPSYLRLKTATGDIVVAGGSDDASLTTVSGKITVASGRFERGRLESVTGGILFGGDVAPGGSLDVDTHSGEIDLFVPRTMSADYDVATVAGVIENALTSRQAVAGREGRGQEIGFTTGAGGARVYIRSFKGNIRLEPPGNMRLKVF